jgi:hypothetical protein
MVENALAVTSFGFEDSTRDLAIWFTAGQLDVLRTVENSGSRHGTARVFSA